MFYCQRVVGDAGFSIKEWNEQFKICCDLDIDMPSDELEPCSSQCDACINIILEQQKKTRELIERAERLKKMQPREIK